MAIIKKSTNNKCWRGCGEKGALLHYWCDRKLVHPLWKAVWRVLRKLKRELSYDPAVPLLGIYLDKTVIQIDTCTPVFIAALFTIVKKPPESCQPSGRQSRSSQPWGRLASLGSWRPHSPSAHFHLPPVQSLEKEHFCVSALTCKQANTPNIRNFSTGHRGLLGQLLLDKKRITPRWAGD